MDWSKVNASVERLLGRQIGVNVPFTHDGHEYHGCRTSLRREDVNTDAGLADAYSFSLLCPASQFADGGVPKPRVSKITLGGQDYRVLAVERDATLATVRLHLGEVLA